MPVLPLPQTRLHDVESHHLAGSCGQVIFVTGEGPQPLVPLVGAALHLDASVTHLLLGETTDQERLEKPGGERDTLS